MDLNFICHHLNVNPFAIPKKQPPRRSSKEHSDAVRGEVLKLKQAGAINEVFYPRMAGQHSSGEKENWEVASMSRLYNLHKVCPKYPFPLSRIDQLVDATIGHPRMRFLDAFQGYHLIPLALDDQENTIFLTPTGNYHYKVMTFGLKNARSTYQRMITRMFEPQLGKNIEVYIDDMVVNTIVESEHVDDLGNIFEILRKHKLHLNAAKCSFSIGFGKFLDYMVTHCGIEVDPNQIRAINDLWPP